MDLDYDQRHYKKTSDNKNQSGADSTDEPNVMSAMLHTESAL